MKRWRTPSTVCIIIFIFSLCQDADSVRCSQETGTDVFTRRTPENYTARRP
jgi:hypothetical protein